MSATRRAVSSPLASQTLAIVLAGGNGTRLGELTRWHAKPALPFAGQYRNIDFTLSNCVNSGTRRIAVLTQYKAHSLIQHLRRGWSFLPSETGEFLEVWPAQQRRGLAWYGGTADAVFQNLDLIEAHSPDYVLVLAGDHIYQMNYVRLLEAHIDAGADVTVGCIAVPISEASAFGVVEIDDAGRITRFDEKPTRPRSLPDDASSALASMGIYVFNRGLLGNCLANDAMEGASRHDFGHDILPRLLDRGAGLQAYVFREAPSGRAAYWRDVGTVESYWKAHMELLVDRPGVDLNDHAWPIRTDRPEGPAARFTGQGLACQSIVSAGCLVGGRVEQSVLSMNCRVAPGALVESSVLLPDVEVGADCRISNAVIGPGCRIAPGTLLGRSPLIRLDFDEAWPSGVTLVTAESLAETGTTLPEPRIESALAAAHRGAQENGEPRSGIRLVR